MNNTNQKPLTNREREVLRLISEGFTNKHIASLLIISDETVKKHNKNIFQKLKVRNRTEAVFMHFKTF